MRLQSLSRAALLWMLLLGAAVSQLSLVSAADSYDSLVAAIQAANSGGSGEITLSGDIVLTAALPPITGRVTIEGAGHTISGDGKYRIFDVAGGRLALSNVTLAGGKATDSTGGAIRLRNGAEVSIESSTLSTNSATHGGAIATSSSSDRLNVSDSSFVSNKADKNGGAIYANGGIIQIYRGVFEKNCAELAAHSVDINLAKPRQDRSVDDDGCLHIWNVWNRPEDVNRPLYGQGGAITLLNEGQATVDESKFSKNKAKHGGAFALMSGDVKLTVRDSSFERNFAHSAGVVYIDAGAALISRSSFLNNFAAHIGGTLVGNAGEIEIANSTFYDNRAGTRGGVIEAAGADITMTHLTLVKNRATQAGADTLHKTGGSVRLRNSIIVNSGVSNDCVGGLDQMTSNLSTDGTCALLASGDPLLEQVTGEPARYSLKDFSPAVDAADPDYCLEVDQVGTPRPHGGGCDIGAFESTTALPKPPPIEPPPPCPLALQIIAANTDAPAGGCPAGNGHDIITLTGDIELDDRLPNISSDITIEGKGFTISGGERFRILDVERGTLILNNLTLVDGKATFRSDDYGGAIRVQGSGTVFVNDSTFRNNYATNGGAIGGDGTRGARATVNNSRFAGNIAQWFGGAVAWNTPSGSISISNSGFYKNTAPFGDGGAIGVRSGLASINNSTFTGNRARNGGAVYIHWATVTLTHVTMLENSAILGASLLADTFGFAGSLASVRLRNSLLAGRSTSHCAGRLTESTGNFIADGSCSAKLSGNPLLEQANDGSEAAHLELMPGSPAIDAADPRYCLPTDQLGRERPLFSLCDIGAIESVPVSTSVSDCTVTTTHTLNFREQPGGTRFGTVPENATVAATARTPGWFQVEYRGASGWISADYVVAQGVCG